jgi:curved DNA-binding protein CbpA
MSAPSPDPYASLGVPPSASDDEIRRAYRRLVQRHHPDHNQGSHASAVHFAAVQEAYAQVKVHRAAAASTAASSSDPALDDRLARMEQELAAARAQREKALRDAEHAARQAAASGPERASDEELGYVSTDDSISKILDDFADQVSSRFSEAQDAARDAREQPRRERPRSLADWVDELGSRLTGDGHDRDS